MDRETQNKSRVNNMTVVTQKRRGGPGKKDKTYKKLQGNDMAYLCMRAGSPYIHVRKRMGAGKILFESLKTTSKSLARIRRDEKIGSYNGQTKATTRKTFAEAFDELRAIKENSLEDLSYRNHYIYPWETLKEHIGSMFVDEFTAKDYETLTGNLWKENPEASMANFYELLKGIVKFSYKARYIKEMPDFTLDTSKEVEPDVNPFTEAEVNLVLKNCEGPLQIALIIMAFRGPRPKETRRLKKSFFDLTEDGINLPGFEKIEGKQVRYTKIGKPRFLPLGTMGGFRDLLLSYVRNLPQENLFNYTKDLFEKEWEELRDGLGLEGGLYRFRHHAAVRMLKAGVNPITVAKIMGHDIKTLYRKYSRFLKQDLNDALRNL